MNAEQQPITTTPKDTKPFKINKARQRILEDIDSIGYKKQNEELMELGFNKLTRNMKYLIRHKGDVQETLKAFDEKMKAKEEKRKLKFENKGSLDKEDKPKKEKK